ncbi:MAG: hypothetical protein R2877_00720 [Bdellovibrionota bacterium]
MLYDIQKLQWSKNSAINSRFNAHPSEGFAIHRPFWQCSQSFFGSEIPILGVLGDQQASLFGHGATKPFQAKCTFGTGAFALVHTGSKPMFSKNKLLTTLACTQDTQPQYALEGSVHGRLHHSMVAR